MTLQTNAMPAAPTPLTREHVRILSLSALGGALEFYDFIIFVFFASIIGQLFFPADMPEWLRQLQTFGIFAAGYLARPLGGILMAHFGDLLGRKKMFTLSIFLMALPTLCIGLLPTYATVGYLAPLLMVLMRVLQGAAVGGEVPGAWVFVSEHVHRQRVGFACGTLSAGLVFGILIGSLVSTAFNASFSPQELLDYAWRLPFLLGGVFGFVAVYLRRYLHETPVFCELRQRQALAEELPLKAVVRGHLDGVALSMIVTWILTAAVVVVVLMTPTLLQKQFGISPVAALGANAIAIVAVVVGCVLSGWSADRFGGGITLLVWSLWLAISYGALLALLPTHPDWLIPLYVTAGFGVGITGVVPAIAVKAFPAPIRFSGLSFSYNLAYALFGGFTPILVSLLASVNRIAPAGYVALVAGLGVATGLFLITARHGRRLAIQHFPGHRPH